MATKYYKITAKELLALADIADTCSGMIGAAGGEGFDEEALAAQKAIKSICKRNGIVIDQDYSDVDIKI